MDWHKKLQLQKIVPIDIFQDQQKTVEVYIAKGWGEKSFRSSLLLQIVKTARKSYQSSYGDDIPLIDNYDQKSAVYFALCRYKDKKTGLNFQEILSVRFTPVLGYPLGNYDVDLYHFPNSLGSNVVSELYSSLIEQKKWQENHFEKSLFSISRMCAVRPQSGQKRLKKNKYTNRCFWSMVRACVRDLNSIGIMQVCLTVQMLPKMRDKLIEIEEVRQVMVSAQSILSPNFDKQIQVDRQRHEKYVYSYPGYFLQVEKLTNVINTLINQGKLLQSDIEQHIDSNRNWQEVVRNPHFLDYRQMGRYLTKEGDILSDFAFADLRALLTREVPDGTHLYILTF